VPAEQASFIDGAAWHNGIAQAFCLDEGDP
jgi:hypothetical protein